MGKMGENRGINERGKSGKKLIKNINPKSSILNIILCIFSYIRVIRQMLSEHLLYIKIHYSIEGKLLTSDKFIIHKEKRISELHQRMREYRPRKRKF